VIGKIVDHIIDAGYNVSISQGERSILLIIGKTVNGVAYAVDWYASGVGAAQMSEVLLMDVVEEKLEALRQSIARGW
jgi:hypothetical protein